MSIDVMHDTTRKGRFRVRKLAGSKITSEHNDLLEAVSAASRLGPGNHLIQQPDIVVTVHPPAVVEAPAPVPVPPVPPAPIPAPPAPVPAPPASVPTPAPAPAPAPVPVPVPVPVPPPPSTATPPASPPPAALVLRNPLLPGVRPFDHLSPYNQPLGSRAIGVPANLPTDYTGYLKGTAAKEVPWVSMPYDDSDYIVWVSPDDPLMQLVQSAWSPAAARVVPLAKPTASMAPVPWPRALKIRRTVDNCSVHVVLPDGSVRSFQPATREDDELRVFFNAPCPDSSLWTDGVPGPHGGSRMSGIGLCLEAHEMLPGASIDHPLGVLIDMAFAHKPARRAEGHSWVKPAFTSDRGTMNGPGTTGLEDVGYGTFRAGPRELMMGARLRIDPALDATQLGLRTEIAVRIVRCLQTWGAYLIDNALRQFTFATANVWRDGKLTSATAEFQRVNGFPFHQRRNSTGPGAAWNADVRKIVELLQVVANTSPAAWGGPGDPAAPLYPPLIARQ